MSAKVEALVAKHSKLRGSAKTVLLAIARLAPRDDGGGVYASVETIAKQSGWSVDTARRAFRKARDNDELAVYYNRGPNGTNHYQVRVDVLTKRDTNAKTRLATKAPPADCTSRKLRDKGSVLRREQYPSPSASEGFAENPSASTPSTPIRQSSSATTRTDDARARAEQNGYLTCPDCGRYGGGCHCDDSLQASFDRAMRDTLDAGKPGPAHLASEAALRKAYLSGEHGKVRNVTQAEVDAGWDAWERELAAHNRPR